MQGHADKVTAILEKDMDALAPGIAAQARRLIEDAGNIKVRADKGTDVHKDLDLPPH